MYCTVKLETIVEEIEEAAVYIMKYAIKLGSRRVVFGGHSAGAHLLAMLLSSVWYSKLHDDQRKLINGFILFSGVFDLKPIVNTYINDALSLSQSDARLLSPMFLDVKQSGCEKLPKILVVVGQYDSPAFQEQSKQYAQKLQHENYEVSLLTIPDVDHFDIVANLDSDEYILVKTMIEFIKS
uniref:Alpha/beta hydrolase fold-3 domain-containing protein n=1 Tax=Timema bartmani TaxID=61472 RepID=A0A7R9HZI6_9NEOP|nr:unnamed protein product [Timema bartmani]